MFGGGKRSVTPRGTELTQKGYDATRIKVENERYLTRSEIKMKRTRHDRKPPEILKLKIKNSIHRKGVWKSWPMSSGSNPRLWKFKTTVTVMNWLYKPSKAIKIAAESSGNHSKKKTTEKRNAIDSYGHVFVQTSIQTPRTGQPHSLVDSERRHSRDLMGFLCRRNWAHSFCTSEFITNCKLRGWTIFCESRGENKNSEQFKNWELFHRYFGRVILYEQQANLRKPQ